MSAPLAYHITWTAYGNWLHGDPRGWVESGTIGVLPPDDARYRDAVASLADTPVRFTSVQRAIIDQTLVEHCRLRKWELHARNVRSTHVHLVVTAPLLPEPVMDQFKAWCSRRLNEANGAKRKWFTVHGSTKWINDEDYFERAVRSVLEGQD